MSRVHDMGGRFGDGPVKPDFGNKPVFEKEWHARVLALTIASGFLGHWNLDESRHVRECLSPKDYSRFSYYEKWLAGLVDILVEKGVVTSREVEKLSPELASANLVSRVLKPEEVFPSLAKGGPTKRESGPKALFEVGDSVITCRAENKHVSGGHTRLPSYAAGKSGKIISYNGNHVFPDMNAHQAGESPEPLYTVAFLAEVLWEHPESPNDLVMLDLWQSYLVHS